MMKRSLFFILLMVVATSLFADVPQALFMKGSAMAESSVAIRMKRINKDFPESYAGELVQSNTYELFTALKTGEYEFSTTATGGALIASRSITVSSSGTELVPYRIRVNFDESAPVVTVAKVEEVIIWAPFNKVTVANLDYIGNSSFENDYVEYVNSIWGDPRYRIRVYTEDGDLTTYGYVKGNLTAPDDDSNDTGYFDLYTTTNEDTWNVTIDETPYTGAEFKLSKKRRGEGFPLEPFRVKVIFSSTDNYTHVISDYMPNTSIKEVESKTYSVYPTLIENSMTFVSKEDNLAVEFITVTGVSALKAFSKDNTLKLDNILLPKGIYLVKITSAGKLSGVERVIKL
jgi:hypothetical protein